METSSKKWAIKEYDVISKIFESLKNFIEKTPQLFLCKFFEKKEIHDCKYLQIYGLISVFEIIFMDTKAVSNNEDLFYIVSAIIDKDSSMNILEQLTMYNSKPIMYQASLVIAQTLFLLYNSTEKAEFTQKQNKIMMSSTILLWNIRLMLGTGSTRQQRISSRVAVLVVVRNNEGCSLMSRIFPKSLLKKVEEEKNYVEWRPEDWREFFILMQNNYQTATEQWYEECRQELKEKLKNTAIEYLSVKYAKGNEEPIQWNYKEYYIQYDCLEEKCKVGKYYLKDLLNTKEGYLPFLTERIMRPIPFWNVYINMK